VRDLLCAEIPQPGPDQFIAPHLAAAERLVRAGRILEAAEGAGVSIA
jgi:hypothetical protein